MGGPCLLPPTHYSAYDTPYTTGNIVAKSCLQETAEDGSCVVAMGRECYCNENNVQMGNNSVAFPWGIGMMYNFSVGYDSKIPIGSEKNDAFFGELPNAKWTLRNMNSLMP